MCSVESLPQELRFSRYTRAFSFYATLTPQAHRWIPAKEPEYLALAASTLLILGGHEDTRLLRILAQSPDPTLRAVGAWRLVELGEPDATELARSVLATTGPEVRIARLRVAASSNLRQTARRLHAATAFNVHTQLGGPSCSTRLHLSNMVLQLLTARRPRHQAADHFRGKCAHRPNHPGSPLVLNQRLARIAVENEVTRRKLTPDDPPILHQENEARITG